MRVEVKRENDTFVIEVQPSDEIPRFWAEFSSKCDADREADKLRYLIAFVEGKAIERTLIGAVAGSGLETESVLDLVRFAHRNPERVGP